MYPLTFNRNISLQRILEHYISWSHNIMSLENIIHSLYPIDIPERFLPFLATC